MFTSDGARVESIEVVRRFRTALLKFAERANVALSDAEGEMQRVLLWLEHDQAQHWKTQLRKRTELVSRCKEAVRAKKLFTDATGHRSSAVDEEKALAKAQRLLEEAEQKIEAVRKWKLRLEREILLYKGSVQPLSTHLLTDVPLAAAKLEQWAQSLDAYVSQRPPAATDHDRGEAAGGMSRSEAQPSLFQTLAAACRGRVPAPEQRRSAARGDASMVALDGALSDADHFAVATLVVERVPVAPEHRLTVETNLSADDAFYLHRAQPASPDDSGWHVGRADVPDIDAPAPQIVSIPVRDLLERRPDLAEVLTLPVGSLVLIQGDGVRAVLNERDAPLIV